MTRLALRSFVVLLVAAALAHAEQPPSFRTQILPVLHAKCSKCHGEKKQKGDLNLSTAATLLKGGESGPVLVAGKPEKSPLFEKIHAGEMPPKKEPQLTEGEIEAIRTWIVAGAKTEAVEAEPQINQHDIGPIIMRRCTACHGARRKEASLDLRTKASMLKGGKSGPAIVIGKPEESLLVKRVRANQMPPPTRLVEVSVKPMEQTELDVIVKWIAAGAPEVNIAPDIATTTPDPLVSAKDRGFWAFKAPRRPALPSVQAAARVRNPIDAFILQKLEAKGMTLAPEADRATLLRRVSFDLTGLPPDPAEAQAFLADRSADAYERMVDRLLASPRYGERWGRHWLDVAGYADSEGKREQDHYRKYAWRYRDYVIRAFNSDKPYSRFLLEQIAGDELADYEHAKEITPEIYDNLVATAFLRMVPDATWANITNYLPDRMEVLADEMDVLGSGVLGLTMKCARCHSHKFDPIPQRDYYRLLAVFKGAYDVNDWLKPDLVPGDAPLSTDVLPGRVLPYVTTAERREWEARKNKGPEPKIQALWDRGEPSPTYIYRRGDPMQPSRLVGPGVPSVLTDGKTPFAVQPPWPGAKKTGRRLAFAKWLTQDNNPLTARVIVNRIWKEHFGRGIVASLGNFGKAGSPPTHPELLDWLAVEFVNRGWSIKEMQRLMLTSSTYRQQSQARSEQANALFGRMPLTRLDAESLYDTMLLIAGRLDERRYGPGDAVQTRGDGLVTPNGTESGWRRLIYVRQMRKQMPTHLETFDFAQMNPNCIERRDSTVAPQALYMMNNAMVDGLAQKFAERVIREGGNDVAAQVERAYWIALGRGPSKDERELGVNALKELSEEWTKTDKPREVEASRNALKTYCRALVNSAGFMYVD